MGSAVSEPGQMRGLILVFLFCPEFIMLPAWKQEVQIPKIYIHSLRFIKVNNQGVSLWIQDRHYL